MGRKGAQAHGFPGHDLDGRISRSQIIQLTQPFLLPASGDHGGIIKGQVPAGENRRGLTQKAAEFFLSPAGCHIILAEHHNRPACVSAQSGNHMTSVDLTNAGNGGVLSGINALYQRSVFRNGFQKKKQWLFHGSPHNWEKAERGKAERDLFPSPCE